MWTRKELKDKAKIAFKANYWKTVLVALLFAAVSGTVSATFVGGTAGGSAATGSSYAYSFDPDSRVVVTEDMTDEEFKSLMEENGIDPEALEGLEDIDMPVEELIESTTVEPGDEYHEPIPVIGIAVFALFLLAVVLVIMAIALVIDAFLINPLSVGAYRFSICNLNQKAQVKETAYAFDNNYLEIVKTMFLRDIFTLLWTLLFIIPGIVKAYEYRMIPYLLADDPTMTKDRAFAESRAMMQGNKWRAFVLDLSFLGWHLLSLFTLGLLEVFYVAPYEFMTDAALYESLRYGTPAAQQVSFGTADQIPVAAFAEEGGFAPENPVA